MDSNYKIPLEIVHAFNNAEEPRGVKDLDSRFMYANRAYKKLLGLPEDFQLVGKSLGQLKLDLVGLWESSRLHEMQVITSCKPIRSLEIFPFSNGEYEAYIFERGPFFNRNGEVIGTAFMGRDVKGFLALEFITKMQGDRLPISENADPLQNLKEREWEIIFLICRNYSRSSVAKKLGISEDWTHKCLKNIYERFNVHSVEELTRFALERGWLTTFPKGLLPDIEGYFVL
ncbi:TPA: PAS domain-containing protein [Salmonella enterica subsp. salamae serovar 35:g,m,s,t:-]|nr:PAS domain-containing protein [Salmonella enterica subsp. salamae serovar 35:g,m,s,t:-]HCA3549683.1 PAS domain-containing protein [Salmonella enterica subsp. salamae serovar 35:g,m,s,t:-]